MPTDSSYTGSYTPGKIAQAIAAGVKSKSVGYVGGNVTSQVIGGIAVANIVIEQLYEESLIARSNPMILTFNYSVPTTMYLPIQNPDDPITIDWGDGIAIPAILDSVGAIGTLVGSTVKIYGLFDSFRQTVAPVGLVNFRQKLVSVVSWGVNASLLSLSGAFNGCTALISVPPTLPRTVTDTSRMFSGATAFNGQIGSWIVDSVTDMSYMFSDASVFNRQISSWVVDSVTDMTSMFSGASAFNANISMWDTHTVYSMTDMFSGALAFNNSAAPGAAGFPLFWVTHNVTCMAGMFSDATSFNQDVATFDLSGALDLSYMFSGATQFNNGGDDLLWDISATTDMSYMFYGASSFNQDLSTWHTGTVTNMSYMFAGTAASYTNGLFNWNLNGYWDVTHVTNFSNFFNPDGIDTSTLDPNSPFVIKTRPVS